MKKFLARLSIVFAFVLLLLLVEIGMFLWFVANGTPQYSTAFTASILDKYQRLISIEEPKIIMVGNSNLAVGLNSAELEEAFDMPVVNLGLHGGLGNAMHEELAKKNIGEGDVVVVCHADYGDNGAALDAELVCLTLETHTELYSIVSWRDILPIMRAFPHYLQKNLNYARTGTGNQSWGGLYERAAFNEYGDNIYPRETQTYRFQEYDEILPTVSNTCANRLNALNEYCLEQGATLVVAGYPIADGEFTAPRAEFDAFQKTLEEKLDCPVISNVNDYFFPYDNFYDSYLHLTDEGTALRTQQLIADLTAYFAQETAK